MNPDELIDEKFFCRGIRVPSGLRFPCDNIIATTIVLTKFSHYFINIRQHLFIETELGFAVVDAVNESGIHVMYFTGKRSGNSEWIRTANLHGDLTKTKRTLIQHPK